MQKRKRMEVVVRAEHGSRSKSDILKFNGMGSRIDRKILDLIGSGTRNWDQALRSYFRFRFHAYIICHLAFSFIYHWSGSYWAKIKQAQYKVTIMQEHVQSTIFCLIRLNILVVTPRYVSPSVRRSVGPSAGWLVPFLLFWRFWALQANCFCPDALVSHKLWPSPARDQGSRVCIQPCYSTRPFTILHGSQWVGAV